MRDKALIEITGEYIDTIRYKDGRVETRKGKNLIVDGVYKLIASLMIGKEEYKPLCFWAVGKGQDLWSNDAPPQPNPSDTKLLAEIGRKAIIPGDMTWVDDRGEVSSSPTNRIKVRATFGYNDCVGVWREFGIFGGNATSSKDSGIMIDRKTHGTITKTREMELDREIIFTFKKTEEV